VAPAVVHCGDGRAVRCFHPHDEAELVA